MEASLLDRPADLAMPVADAILNTLPHPVFWLDGTDQIVDANAATETFFELSLSILRKHRLSDLFARMSPVLALIAQARDEGMTFNEHGLLLELPKLAAEKLVDVFAGPLHENSDIIVVMLKEKTIAEKISRQLTHRGAARSVSALAAMLAHEIKNPLSGIRGAAPIAGAGRQRRRPDPDGTHSRGDRPHRPPRRALRGVFRRPPDHSGASQHSFGARSCETHRPLRLCPRYRNRRGLRSVPAVRRWQQRSPDSGLPQPREERGRSR